MSVLGDQIPETLLPGMNLTSSLDLLFSWIEAKEFFVDIAERRIGLLFPEAQLKDEWATQRGQAAPTSRSLLKATSI